LDIAVTADSSPKKSGPDCGDERTSAAAEASITEISEKRISLLELVVGEAWDMVKRGLDGAGLARFVCI
jgi:hypothetical protein